MPDELTAEQHIAEADRLTRDWNPLDGSDFGTAATPIVRAQWHLIRAEILRQATAARPPMVHYEVGDYPNGRDWVSVGRCLCGAPWPCPAVPPEQLEDDATFEAHCDGRDCGRRPCPVCAG